MESDPSFQHDFDAAEGRLVNNHSSALPAFQKARYAFDRNNGREVDALRGTDSTTSAALVTRDAVQTALRAILETDDLEDAVACLEQAVIAFIAATRVLGIHPSPSPSQSRPIRTEQTPDSIPITPQPQSLLAHDSNAKPQASIFDEINAMDLTEESLNSTVEEDSFKQPVSRHIYGRTVASKDSKNFKGNTISPGASSARAFASSNRARHSYGTITVTGGQLILGNVVHRRGLRCPASTAAEIDRFINENPDTVRDLDSEGDFNQV